MNKLAVAVAAVLVLSKLGAAYSFEPQPNNNPCKGIDPEQVMETFNAHGWLTSGGLRTHANSVFGLHSSTEAFGAGYPGFCTGYMSLTIENRGTYIQDINAEITKDGSIKVTPLAMFSR